MARGVATANPKPRKQRPPECWACGKLAPQCSYVGRFGWRTRAVQVEYYTMTEVYCPDCFARWGWPEPIERESPELDSQTGGGMTW